VYPIRRWRWVDTRAGSDRVKLVRARGPFDGACPVCAAPARARAPWVELGEREAVLHVTADRRGEMADVLSSHLAAVERATRAVGSHTPDRFQHLAWPAALLQPTPRFDDEAPAQRPRPVEAHERVSAPLRALPKPTLRTDEPTPAESVSEELVTPIEPLTTDDAQTVQPASEQGPEAARAPADPEAGIPQAVGSGIIARGRPGSPAVGTGADVQSTGHALIGTLMLAEGTVTLHADVDVASRRLWGTAALRARPLHLRDLDYPLLGIRVVASYLGQVSVIDGVIDVGSEEANAVLHALSREFRLELILHSPDTSTLPREVEAPGLERNAALCMESARAALAAGEYPPESFARAVEQLAALGVDERMAEPPVSLGMGDYRFLVSPGETWLALEHLDDVSAPDNLAQLLEVHGFPVSEFEEIRRRVLAASVEHGICAPRRFWRRVVDSGLAEDGKDYVKKLINGRLGCERAAKADDGAEDLSDAHRKDAWQRIYDYCEAKNYTQPKPVLSALGLRVADQGVNKKKGGGNPSRMASGVIGGGGGTSGGRSPALADLADRLKDPKKRMGAAVDVLQNDADEDRLAEVLGKLDGFDPDELVGILAALNETRGDPVTGLVSKLLSPTRELRQVAAFVLGSRGAAAALEPLSDLLVRERTAAWHDVARAIGTFGEGALPSLRALLDGFGARDKAKIDRVARALAEVGLVAGEPTLEGLTREDGLVAVAAERALAMMAVVRRDGERIRGEAPSENANPAHEFSRRLHESVMVEEVEDLEVEMVEETQVIRLEDLEMM